MSTEHQRIALLRALFERSSPAISLGIGDDCAVLAGNARLRVWTVDAAIEEVHFSRSFMRDEEIGYRAFMAAASDIAAMGADASAALCALALPSTLSDESFAALLCGIAEAADQLGCPVVGGNLARAAELSLTITVLGECERALTRSGALPAQGIFVSGPLGGSALGLAALRQGHPRSGRYADCVARFLRPRARLELSAGLASRASAAIDVSDGLAQDLRHLCDASGVGAVVELPSIPRLPDFDIRARELGCDPHALVLAGGEDYELLFTAEPGAVPPELGIQIGRIVETPGLQLRDQAGREVAAPLGFDHFR